MRSISQQTTVTHRGNNNSIFLFAERMPNQLVLDELCNFDGNANNARFKRTDMKMMNPRKVFFTVQWSASVSFFLKQYPRAVRFPVQYVKGSHDFSVCSHNIVAADG